MSDNSVRLDSDDGLHPISIIRDLDHPNIRSSEKAVLWAMASQLNLPKGRDTIFSSMSTIAKNAGMDESAARRIVNWFVAVGVLVEVEGPYRSKCRKVDFERLVSLPTDGKRVRGVHVSAALDVVQGDQDQDTQYCTSAPLDHGAPTQDVGAPIRVLVPPDRDVGAPKNDFKNKRRTNEEQFPARVPRRSRTVNGATLGLDFGPVDPPTLAPIPEPLPVRPETLPPSPVALPVETTNPPPKGKGKAGKKADGGTERASRWPDGFGLDAEMVEYAIKRGMNGPAMVADEFERFENYHKSKGSKFVSWKLAFYNWVRNWEDRSRKNAPYQNQKKRVSSAQIEPDASYWENRAGDTMEDLGS